MICKKKITLFAILFSLFCVLITLHHPLLCWMMKAYLHKQLPKENKLTISYQTTRFQRGQLVLHDVTIKYLEKERDSGVYVHIDRLKCFMSLTLFPFSFKPEIALDHPKIILLGKDIKTLSNTLSIYQLLGHHLLHTPITINRGEFCFGDKHTFFNFQNSEDNKAKKLDFYQQEGQNPTFSAMIEKQDSQLECNLILEKLDVSWITTIGSHLFPTLIEKIDITRGQITGKFSCFLSQSNRIDSIRYSLVVNDLLLSYETYGVKVGVDYLTWKGTIPLQSETNQTQSLSLLDKIWPHFLGKATITGGYIIIDGPTGNNFWTATNIQGDWHSNKQNSPYLCLCGIFNREGREHAFQLTNKDIFEGHTLQKAMIDLCIFNEEHSQIHLSISPKEAHHYFFQTEAISVGTDFLTLIHYLMSIYLPQLKELKIQNGIFSGKIQGWIQGKEFMQCEIIDCLVEHIQATTFNKKITWQAQKITGQGKFDLSTSDIFDGAYWDLDLEGGCITQDEGLQIEQITSHFSMYDHYVKPSNITMCINGIKGEATIEGLYHRLHLHIYSSLFLRDLLRLVGHEDKDFENQLTFHLNMHSQILKDKIAIEGTLFLHEQEEKDSIQFGWNWNLDSLKKGKIQNAIDLGWFKATHFSASTMNLLLLVGGQNWCGKGYLDFEGTFNAHRVDLCFDPTHLTYISSVIDLEPNKTNNEKAPYCRATFDFKTRNWSGNIPLKNMRIKAHTSGIIFDSFTAEMSLEQQEWICRNVDAIAHGVHFQGEIGVYQNATHKELVINTDQIDGTIQDVLSLLRHFKPFSTINLPLEGKIISGPQDMQLRLYIGDRNEILDWKVALHFEEGSFPFSEALSLRNLSGDLSYSTKEHIFQIYNGQGHLCLCGAEHPKLYQLTIPLIKFDIMNGSWDYELKLEAPTHDIFKVVGTALYEDEELKFILNNDQTQLFGSKVDISTLAFTKNGALSRMNAQATLSALDLLHHLEFLTLSGFMPLKIMMEEETQTTQCEGEVSLLFTFNRKKKELEFTAKSMGLVCGPINCSHLAIHIERMDNQLLFDRFEMDGLAIKASMNKDEAGWIIPQLEIARKNCYFNSYAGYYDQNTHNLHLSSTHLQIDVKELIEFLPSSSNFDYLDYFTGTLLSTGSFTLDLSQGLKNPSFYSDIKLIGKGCGKGNLCLENSGTLHLSFNNEQGLEIKNAHLHFLNSESHTIWAKCHFDTLSYLNNTWKGENVMLTIPPEMIHFLGKTDSIPHLICENESLILFTHSIHWNNQIEATINFTIGKESKADGQLKEGYYWLGGQAWYFHDCFFSFTKNHFDFNVHTLLNNKSLNIQMHSAYPPHFSSKIMVQESKDTKQEHSEPFVAQIAWNEHEGHYLHSISGQICGLEFDFHHNPKKSFYAQAVLTGQLKVNMPMLSPLLPEKVQKVIKKFEIGNGYKLSGDVILPKEQLEDVHFIGHLKGKNFHLMGLTMETLMSEVIIHPHQIELANCNISDTSGLFKVDKICICKEPNKKWNLAIPTLMIQDFRPSLLKKQGQQPGRIKPFMIRELYFHNICGYPEEANSFTGQGRLHFINTFKREYNLLDIPLDILGRLGLDMGLLIPVRGDLDFTMEEGRICLTELKKSYSEGNRSQFFLSSTQPSHIDFDGTININITMKQYVLLKPTESFILSIAGTVDNLKYGLK